MNAKRRELGRGHLGIICVKPDGGVKCADHPNQTISIDPEAQMRGLFSALQLFAAFFLAILGLALAFRPASDQGPMFLGALLGGAGLTYLALISINVRKAD